MLLDIHAHLEMCKDSKKAISNAQKILIVANGVNPESNRKALEFANNFSNVKCSLGIYPIDALKMSEEEFERELNFIESKKDKIIGIGEVGIDLKESQDFEKQKNNFIKIIDLAKKINKPLIVHSRRAEKQVVEILEKEKCKKVIMHCFNGNFSLVKRILENGWYLTIPTCVTRSEHFQKMILEVPLDRLFCETDSPYLHPFGERNNEPANVIESYKKIAEIKRIDLDEVETQLEDNFKELFG